MHCTWSLQSYMKETNTVILSGAIHMEDDTTGGVDVKNTMDR